MRTLTKQNVNEHCCTCLTMLHLPTVEFYENVSEQKFVCINDNNAELQQLLRQCVHRVFQLDFKQNVCLDCLSILQNFVKFRQRALYCAAKLQELYDNNDLAKVEIENDWEQQQQQATQMDTSLLETETVLLENADSTSIVAKDDPDPFEVTTVATVKAVHASDDDDYDDEFCAEQQHQQELSEATTSADEQPLAVGKKLHLRNKNNTNNNNTTCTRKRRTKKEMQEFRESQKREIKFKRRNKGTKNTFKCQQCNHSFAHKITCDAHVRKVHEGHKRPYQCDRCEKSYTFIGGLYTHIKEIHETQVRSYTCDHAGCERVYTSFIAMQKHKRLKHTADITLKKYVCEQCGATFNQSGNLKYHRRSKHPTEAEQAEKEQTKERFECTVCKKLFHSRYTLKYHTLQLHTNDMKYECTICGRRMAKRFMLVQHMLVHSTEKLPCEHCGKQFIRKFELEAHIRAVHMKLKPFECSYCFERFASRKTLRHHEYIHTNEKPYVCDVCGQAYRQQTCLKNHRKTHEKLSADAMQPFLLPAATIRKSSAVAVEETKATTAISTQCASNVSNNY